MKKTLFLLFSCMLLGLISTWGQNQESKQISQELLMKYCWEYTGPVTLSEGVTHYMIFNESEKIHYYVKNGKSSKVIRKYYISDHNEGVFDESKVGKVKKGRFIVIKEDGFVDIKETLDAISYEPVEFSEQKLILAPRTDHLDRTYPTDNYIARPLNYLDEKIKE